MKMFATAAAVSLLLMATASEARDWSAGTTGTATRAQPKFNRIGEPVHHPAQSSYDDPADLQDNFQGFIERHPKIAKAIENGTAATSSLNIRHTQGCTSNCSETLAHWAARHQDAIAEWNADHQGTTQ